MLDREHVRQVFTAALGLAGSQRVAYLDHACSANQSLRDEVESLLQAFEQHPRFLSSPTAATSDSSKHAGDDIRGTHIGSYVLHEEIGQGGFGVVYSAEQQTPVRRRVALKIIKLGMDTRAVIARFEAERQSLALMDHANIARVFDAGATDSGRPYFVMELVRGEPITHYCDRHNLSIRERLDVFLQVCHAVQHAHSKGVIHRDIKPGNVLVATEDGRPFVKVIDFGIAKAIQRHHAEKTLFTDFKHFVGTPEYMSPEQAESSLNIDTRTDIYSLGVLLYELLTGVTPFDAKSLRSAAYAEMQRIIREVDPPKPSTRLSQSDSAADVSVLRRTQPARLCALVKGDLDWIVMKTLDKDRARRYDTASALAADITRYLSHAPVEAAPPSRVYRARKFAAKHRLAVFTVAAVAAALVLGIIGTSIGLVAANRASARATESAKRASAEAEQARAVNEFMREVLTSVEPQNGGADVRLIDVMARATETASKRFESHPLLEAQVQDLLAAVHQHIGTFAFSKAAADRACVLYEAHAGRDDPRTLRAEARVIGAALNLNKTSEAEPMIDALLPRVQRVLGEGDLTTLEVRRAQATVHMLRGRLDESETLYLELLAHPTLTLDDRTQSRILFSLCRLRQRRPFLEDAAQRTEYLRRSEELARQCVDKSHRAAGPGSLDVLRAQVILAQALCDMNRYAETAELTREVLSVSEEKFESCHMVRHTAMSVLADALSGMGEFDEPAALYGRIIACLRASAASDSITFISNLTDGLKYFDRSGRAAEGEAITREGLDVLARFSGSHNDVTLILNSYLAHFISSSGRADEAEPMFEKLLAPIESVSSKQARARFHKFYAAHLVRRGKFKDSEERLGLALSIYGSAAAHSRDRVPDEIVCGYVELYKAWDKPDKVREYEQLRLDMFGIPPRS